MKSDYPDYTDVMQIIGSDIMVPFDIQGAYIMMPVDIQAQYVNVEVDIVAQTVGNIGIDIKAATIGTIAIDIKTATIGNLTIDIEAQSVGVYMQPEWAALQGTDKSFYASTDSAEWNGYAEDTWDVVGGDNLYITAFGASCIPHGFVDEDKTMIFVVDIGDIETGGEMLHQGGNYGCSLSLSKPLVIPVGHTFSVKITRKGTGVADIKVSAHGYLV